MSRSLRFLVLGGLALFVSLAASADETCQSPYLPEDRRPGGLRLRLDARHRGPRRRLRQARDGRREPGAPRLRQGRLLGLGRRPPRGAPRRLHRRPPPPLGRRPRRRARSSSSTSRPIPAKPKLVQHDHDFVEKTGGVVGPHTFYPLPGRMLITGALERHGRRRAHRRSSSTTTTASFVRTIWMPEGAEYGYDAARQRAPEPHAHVVVHRATRTTCASSAS